jgi:DNA-directed RNA polymerase specialized sigma24 family protein
MTAMFEAVKGLPPKQRKAVLKSVCVTCEDMAMAGALGIQPGMSWD